jgi:DNA-binding YbaB/EbfC family protein
MFKGGIGNIMKQAQKVQEKMQHAQEELAQVEVTGNSGAGLVSLTLNGKYQAKSISIDDSILDDKEMLEDLITAAINDTVEKIARQNAEKMQNVGSDMGLPKGMKLPF